MIRYSMLAIVVALLLGAVAAVAQETPTITPMQIPFDNGAIIAPVDAGGSYSAAAEEAYIWLSRHYTRIGDDGTGNTIDSNTLNFYIPISLGTSGTNTIEVRGVGQMFVPGVIYDYFLPVYTGTDTAGLYVNHAILQEYVAQFQGAGAYSIDSISCAFFKNPYFVGDHSYPAKFYVWKAALGNAYFKSTTGYQRTGLNVNRSTLTASFESELTQEGFDSTINGTSFVRTRLEFDPPLAFNAGDAAIFMLVNDELPTVASPSIDPSNTSEFQTVRGFREYIEGTKKRLTNYKAWSTVLWRTVPSAGSPTDEVRTIWPNIIYGSSAADSLAAILNMSVEFHGTVDLSSGVKYHFGSDASHQGITAIAPNPARETSRITFQMMQVAPVTLDLFDAQGEKIRTLVMSRYAPGVYSYDLNVNDLPNGTYMVRLQAGDQVYTQKINVVK